MNILIFRGALKLVLCEIANLLDLKFTRKYLIGRRTIYSNIKREEKTSSSFNKSHIPYFLIFEQLHQLPNLYN